MTLSANVDQSLIERHGIIRLLNRVEDGSISLDEMAEIGVRLQQSGRRALVPLVRRLWKEKNGDTISRYAYLLDYFEDHTWLDQLVQIALRRRDLEDEGKAALLVTLDGCGIDVSCSPFAELFPAAGPLSRTVPRLLDQGDEGRITFVENFLFNTPEEQASLIRQLSDLPDIRIVSLLEMLFGIDRTDLTREIIDALGKIRRADAIQLLHRIGETGDRETATRCERSLRRLAFLGVRDLGEPRPINSQPFRNSLASPIDAMGFRTLWFSRPTGDGSVFALYLRIHETYGIHSVWGAGDLTEDECAKHEAALDCEEGTVAVSPAYAVGLLRDAIFRCGETGTFIPAEFYVWRMYFNADEVSPSPYVPRIDSCDGRRPAADAWLYQADGTLLDDDYLSGWIMTGNRVYDYAEEWLALDHQNDNHKSVRGAEVLLARFCRELVEPEIERLKRRLIGVADFMAHTGRRREDIAKTVAVAVGLVNPPKNSHRNPFLRRFALESLEIAREALLEGFDLRRQDGDDGCEEWV